MVLFHVCRTDCPAGMSNSSRQSDIGAALQLVTVKLAMKPVCHVDDTDNVAAAAAAWATGVLASAKAVTMKADTIT